MAVNNEHVELFLMRTESHVALVSKYAAKLGRRYSDHDADKFTKLLEWYSLSMKSDMTAQDRIAYNAATLEHITTSTHHPEYWTTDMITTFDRLNPPRVEATNMPEHAIIEMCCDWCAMSEELGNSPFDWFENVNGRRWCFTDSQQQFIRQTLDTLWRSENDEI